MFTFFKTKVQKWSQLLQNTKFAIGHRIRKIFSQKTDDSAFEELEQLLYEADLGVSSIQDLLQTIKTLVRNRETPSSEEILEAIKKDLLLFLSLPEKKREMHHPQVVVVVGANGSGKTTTLAKLAKLHKEAGKKVLLVAADTFRVSATEQLDRWAQQLDIDLIKSQMGSDPSAVVFDGLTAAEKRKSDIVLIDTAGRLQNKTHLMHELEKIIRTCNKVIPSSPHEILLVLDATLGQNAVDQAQTFHSFAPLTGIVLTKLDGTAKGGIAIAVQKKLQVPIQWIGIGESADHLIPFDKESFVNALLEIKGT